MTPPRTSEQLRLDVLRRIAEGELVPGARLPTVRALAAELGLAAGTVAKAYRELESAGAIETRGRAGTVVAARDADADAAAAAADFAARVRALGVDPERALALARAALEA